MSQKIELLVELISRQRKGFVHAVGSTGAMVESIGTGAYIVEIRVPSSQFEGEAWYETFDVLENEFRTLP
jgi:hypothetical protein